MRDIGNVSRKKSYGSVLVLCSSLPQMYISRNPCTCTGYFIEHVERERIMPDDLLATRRFKALAGEWASEELGRFFWISPEDMLQVRTCRGAANRLGFTLNLLLLRLLHCPLPDVTLTPARIIQFVAMQLNAHPDVLAEYSTRQ